MKVASYLFQEMLLKETKNKEEIDVEKCQLVLGFAAKQNLEDGTCYTKLRHNFPSAMIALCSTAGEIYGKEVYEDAVSVVAMQFEKTPINGVSVNINNYKNSYDAGADIVSQLEPVNLKYIFILSDGSSVNGSELVRGIESVVKHKVPVTGGLAGDGNNFKSTLVGLNSNPTTGQIVAIGFYGDSIKVGHGSMGGWEMFGLEKKVTKSNGNELYEIDKDNALDVYKKYLGKYSEELPSSALLFPLSIKLEEDSNPVVRTILSINEDTKSMVFAGDVPEGSKVRFMKANFDNLIDAASSAAENSLVSVNQVNPKLALLISCVGRKIILNKRVEEEIEAVTDIFGDDVLISGFYSYGELSPLHQNAQCELHNQTMTVTIFNEV